MKPSHYSRITTKYSYSGSSPYPSSVTTGENGGVEFTMLHDRRGGLKEVTMPSGHRHEFSMVPLLGKSILVNLHNINRFFATLIKKYWFAVLILGK